MGRARLALATLLAAGAAVLAACAGGSGETDPVQDADITTTTAGLRAHGSCDSGQNPIDYRFQWRIKENGATGGAWTSGSWTYDQTCPRTDSATYTATGLEPGTRYEYRVDVKQGAGTYYECDKNECAPNNSAYDTFITDGSSSSYGNELQFADEFADSALDLDTWRPNWFGANDSSVTSQHGDACADPANVSEGGGYLTLSIQKVNTSCSGTKPYDGAMISSNPNAGGNTEFTYGYIEWRAKLSAQDGEWPALWTDGQLWPNDGEIDILEAGQWTSNPANGGARDVPEAHYHRCTTGCQAGGGAGDVSYSFGGQTMTPDPNTNWHTYGALWEPNSLKIFYDGTQLGSTLTSYVKSSPHYIITQLTHHPGVDAPNDDTLKIDYIRLWE